MFKRYILNWKKDAHSIIIQQRKRRIARGFTLSSIAIGRADLKRIRKILRPDSYRGLISIPINMLTKE